MIPNGCARLVLETFTQVEELIHNNLQVTQIAITGALRNIVAITKAEENGEHDTLEIHHSFTETHFIDHYGMIFSSRPAWNHVLEGNEENRMLQTVENWLKP